MSLQDWDKQGKTKGVQSTFTSYGHALQKCKDYDPAADDYKEKRAHFRVYYTLNFLKNINKYVKRAEGLGKIHPAINWEKMYTISSGSFYWNKERLSSIKSMIDSDKHDDFDELLGLMKAMELYRDNVDTFVDEKLDKMTNVDIRSNRTGNLSIIVGSPVAAVRQGLGNQWQVCAAWVDNVKGLFDLFAKKMCLPLILGVLKKI